MSITGGGCSGRLIIYVMFCAIGDYLGDGVTVPGTAYRVQKIVEADLVIVILNHFPFISFNVLARKR